MKKEGSIHYIDRVIKKDPRGYLVELMKRSDVSNDLFGQLYLSVARPGEVRGNHYHLRKKEWFYVMKGKGLLAALDRKTGVRSEMTLSDKNPRLIFIEPNISHGIKNIGDEDLFLIAYVEEEEFNPADPDTFRDVVVSSDSLNEP
jgi:UDP-2-acetamido-2,6-beta-L-arabino-hexul-4-ose reductase